jgi:isocitrate dehydrogenase
MFKVTPNPPDTDHASPNETTTNTLDPGASIMAIPRTLNSMFIVDPTLDIETLLAHACESLASANVMTMDLADQIDGPRRNALLGIAQVIMLGELAVNRALDQLELPVQP